MTISSSLYVFQGQKFEEYIDIYLLTKQIKDNLHFETNAHDLKELYQEFHNNDSLNTSKLDELVFENIFYGKLKNIYIHNFTSIPRYSSDELSSLIYPLIKTFNIDKTYIADSIKPIMQATGFYCFDNLDVSGFGSTFITALTNTLTDSSVTKTRLLFVHTVPKDTSTSCRYFICGVEIDFINSRCLIMIRNLSNVISTDEESKWYSKVIEYHKKIKTTIFRHFKLHEEFNSNSIKKEMFTMCNKLDTDILDDIKKDISRKLTNTPKLIVNQVLTQLFGQNLLVLDIDREVFIRKFESLILSTYLDAMIDDDDLVAIAKERKLIGYPTRIKFKNGKAASGSTSSSGKNVPLSSTSMFHSIHTEFEDSTNLPQWSLSWFYDFNHMDMSNIDVIQTTIYVTTDYFKIIFLNKSHLRKEFLYHVIGNINK